MDLNIALIKCYYYTYTLYYIRVNHI